MVSCRYRLCCSIGLLLVMVANSSTGQLHSFQFLIQPPKELNCNPFKHNKTWVSALICGGVNNIEGSELIQIQWMYADSAGNISILNRSQEACGDYLVMAVVTGQQLSSELSPSVEGSYWCSANSTSGTIRSNTLVINLETNYSSFADCGEVVFEHENESIPEKSTIVEPTPTPATSMLSETCLVNNAFLNVFISVITIETAVILILISSNVLFMILWLKSKSKKASKVTPKQPVNVPINIEMERTKKKEGSLQRETPPKKRDQRIMSDSHSEKYESMLMSVSHLQIKKKLEAEYVEPAMFSFSSPRAVSTPSLVMTKEIDGKLYAVANPETRNDIEYEQLSKP